MGTFRKFSCKNPFILCVARGRRKSGTECKDEYRGKFFIFLRKKTALRSILLETKGCAILKSEDSCLAVEICPPVHGRISREPQVYLRANRLCLALGMRMEQVVLVLTMIFLILVVLKQK